MTSPIRKAVQGKRRSRREIIAMLFATDIETFSAYQPGRTKIPVYTEGQAYYIALRDGEKAPEGFGQWNKAGDGNGYTIFIAGDAPKSDFSVMADAIMTLKLCMHCGHQFNINEENKAICPKCGVR